METETINHDSVLKQALVYQTVMRSYAQFLLRDWALADDVVQESLLVVMRKWQDFRAGSSVYAWFRGIVRNKAMECLRQKNKFVTATDIELQAAVEGILDERLTEEEAESQKDRMLALLGCVSRVERSSRLLLHGFYVERKPLKELAAHYRQSADYIKTRLYRLRKALYQCVQKNLQAQEM